MAENKKATHKSRCKVVPLQTRHCSTNTGSFVFSIILRSMSVIPRTIHISLSWERRRCSGTGRCPFSFLGGGGDFAVLVPFPFIGAKPISQTASVHVAVRCDRHRQVGWRLGHQQSELSMVGWWRPPPHVRGTRQW